VSDKIYMGGATTYPHSRSEKERLLYIRRVSCLMAYLREKASGLALDDEQDCATLAHMLVRDGWSTKDSF